MINRTSTSGQATYGIQEFVCDSIDDITNLPTDIPMGSTAFIISTGSVYMLNGEKQWMEV